MKYIPDLTIPNTHSEILKVLSTTGVYVYKNGKAILYIGKAVNLKARLLSHEQNAKLDPKDKNIVEISDSIELIYVESEFRALVLEAELISFYKPKYNVRWRDDKSYLYIKITVGEEYPKVLISRKEHDGKSTYFGPFDSLKSVELLLKQIRRIIPFCAQPKIHKNACFYHKIGLCDPCPNEIERLEDKDKALMKRIYRKNIKTIIRILKGETDVVYRVLKREIEYYTKHRLFEFAIKVRDAMRHLDLLNSQVQFSDDQLSGPNRASQSLESLHSMLKPYFPHLDSLNRIECYDNSTLGFEHSTASMIVFTNGMIDKRQYRKFAIKANLDNDFDMMKEVLKRRMNNKWDKPDLIVIDGGKPQIQAVKQVLSSMCLVPSGLEHEPSTSNQALGTVPLIGIAKNPDRLVIGIDDFPIIRPNRHDAGFRLIQHMRDESHRFAKKYHTYLRNKAKMIQ